MAWDRIIIDGDGSTLTFFLDNGTRAACYLFSDGRAWYLGEVPPITGTLKDAQGPITECDQRTTNNLRDSIRELTRRNVELSAIVAYDIPA